MSTPTQERVLAMARGFMESRVVLSGAELGLYGLLAPAPLGAEEIAARIGGSVRPLTILLDALAALGLLEKKEGRYRTEPSAAALLAADAPGSVLPMVLHSAGLWWSWSRLTELAAPEKARHPGSGQEQRRRDPEQLRAFIGAMHVVAAPQADRIVAAIRPGDARSLLDVGGGPGTYALAFLRASPGLRATLFDQPEVVAMARERIAAAGLLDRASFVGGDFYRDDLPGGHDLALLSAIIHQNSTAQNVELYRKVLAALAPGGRLVIRDHVMEPDRTRPAAGAMFAVNMLVNTTGGGTYTLDEIQRSLDEAGFIRVRLLQQGERMDGLVEAFKPA
jgi:predicted O-methyltransferase YrrM